MWLSEQLHAMWSSSSHVERLSIGQQRSQAWTPSGAPSWQLTPRGLPSILKMNLQNPVETFQIKSCATEINCLHWSGSICQKVKVAVAHLCLTLCDPMDCSPPGSSVHGISQARIQEWVAIFCISSFSPLLSGLPLSLMSPGTVVLNFDSTVSIFSLDGALAWKRALVLGFRS